MAGWLQAIGDLLPLTYAVEALRQVGESGEPSAAMWRNAAMVAAAALVSLVAAAGTLRRRSA